MRKTRFLALLAILVVGACSSDSRDICDHISLTNGAAVQIDKCSQTYHNYHAVSYDAYQRPIGFSWEITCADGVKYDGMVDGIAYSNGAISSAQIFVLSCDGSSYSCESGVLSGGICSK
jgi:hypothetical protein